MLLPRNMLTILITHLWQTTAAAIPIHREGFSSIPIDNSSKTAWIP
jgi:hypothetical protein